MGKAKQQKAKRPSFVPLKSYKPITSERQARKATSDFHHGGGDRTRYQAASALLTELHKSSSKFVFRTITKLGLRPAAGKPRLKTFEVGAVNTQLVESPFLDVFAIDLKSRHPSIKEEDFFDVVPGNEYDIVVSAMVLNCVSDPEARGRMLIMCRAHLKPNGLLFLILPKRCFPKNALSRFQWDIMEKLGFKLAEFDSTPKVISACFRLIEETPIEDDLEFHDTDQLLDIIVKGKAESLQAKRESKRARHG